MHFSSLLLSAIPTLISATPLPLSPTKLSLTKRDLVPTLDITYIFPFANYIYEFPNAHCLPMWGGEFHQVTGLDMYEWQFWSVPSSFPPSTLLPSPFFSFFLSSTFIFCQETLHPNPQLTSPLQSLFYPTPNCEDTQTPTIIGPTTDLHSVLKFDPQSMFCYNPTFACPGGGDCK